VDDKQRQRQESKFLTVRAYSERANSLAWLLLLVSLVRTFGGAYLLHLLHAPGWAVAAWLMLHIRVRLGRRQPPLAPSQTAEAVYPRCR
jgi:hypothetical protein